jgi:hypothetical protein
MRLFAASETHPEPWPTVALAFVLRYPNRHAGHILSVDVLGRELTESGTLRTTRLILKVRCLRARVQRDGGTTRAWLAVLCWRRTEEVERERVSADGRRS